MNALKQNELRVENNQLKIRNRALEERLAVADKQVSDKSLQLAVVCYAFKKYIKRTSAPASEPLSEDRATAKLNSLIQDAMKEINGRIATQEQNVDGK